MPLAVCSQCNRFFVLDRPATARSRCPKCRSPLRRCSREEFLAKKLDGIKGGDAAASAASPPHDEGDQS